MAKKTFTQTLDQLRYGTLAEELTAKLNELTAVCTNSEKVGELTLKLKLKPGKGGQVEVFDDVSLKLPKPDRASSIMFATPENNLQREDPRQKSIEGLRSVEETARDLRQVI